MTSRSSVSIGIVGAGPGGLAVAMLLAASGAKVEVYESADRIGGRTSRLQLGEYGFDRGPTFFLMPYVLEEIFAAAGLSLASRVEMTRLDPMYRLVMGQPGGGQLSLDCTQDETAMAKRIAAIAPRDAANFAACLRANRKKLTAFEPILRKPWATLPSLLSTDMLRAGPMLAPTQSVHQWLGKYFKHPFVRLAMCFQAKYLGMSPFECPSLFSILPFIEYEYGVWHPTGGCNAIMAAMARACEEMGVRFHLSSPVDRVTFDGKQTKGVVVRGEERTHDHVVMNADASWALQNLVPAELRKSWSDQRLQGMKYSCSTFMLYLGMKGRVGLPHHTIRIAEDYERNVKEISGAGAGGLSDDPSVYVCNPSAIDPSLAPAGDSALYVLAPVPNSQAGIDWNREAGAFRERVLDRVGGMIGEDIRRRIVREQVITPNDWRGSNIAFGATFNLAHNLKQMLCFRPQHHLPDTRNLWLVGGGTHPGSGLPVIFLSSQITARLLCEQAGLRYAGDAPRALPSGTHDGFTEIKHDRSAAVTAR